MLRSNDRPRLVSKIEQNDGYNHRYCDRRRNPRSESPPPRYNRDDRRCRLSPSYQPYANHHRNPRYEDDARHCTNKKDDFSDSEDDEELKGLTFSEYRRLKRQKLRKKLKNCVWKATPSPPRSERDGSEPLDDHEEDEKKGDDLVKRKKPKSADDDGVPGNRKGSRQNNRYSDESEDGSDSSLDSDSSNDRDDSKGRKSSMKKKSRKSRNDAEKKNSEDSDDSRSRKSSRKKKKNGTDEADNLNDQKIKQSGKERSRKPRMESDDEMSEDSQRDRKRISSRKKRSRKSSSKRKKLSSSSRRSRSSRKSSPSSSEESGKEEDGSASDLSLSPKMKKSSKKPDKAISSDSEAQDELKTVDIDMKTELDPEALAYKELLESQKKNKAEETDSFVGPAPLPRAEGHISYGGALRPGEGDAIAQYVQQGKRIPRRGEVGLSADEIQRFENLGYVMSGSRHQRMNAIRIRKENQVYSAEDKRALAMFNYEEKSKREHKVMADLQRLVQRHIGHDMGPSHDPFGKDTDAADA